MYSDSWAFQCALLALEEARRATRSEGRPPTRWSLTLLWPSGHEEVHHLPPVRNLKALVRHVREIRRLRRPLWLYTTGKLTYRSAGAERPHLLVVLAGEHRCVMLHAAIDTDGNPGPAKVKFDPDPALLGPLLRMGR